jgi:hypothetical protein
MTDETVQSGSEQIRAAALARSFLFRIRNAPWPRLRNNNIPGGTHE